VPTTRLERYRRTLQRALGVLWLLDAALQYQPYMFTTAFPRQVIAPAAVGNPGWVARPVHWSATLMAHHQALANAGFATVQLLIALGLLVRRTTRVALAASVGWALAIWWLGEGLGGILTGAESPITGFPGAALLYAVIAGCLWPPRRDGEVVDRDVSVAASSPAGRAPTAVAWLALWGSAGYEALRAANRSPSALHSLFVDAEAGEPGWIQAIDRTAARAVAHHGTEVSIALAVVLGIVAITVAVGAAPWVRAGVVVAAVFGVVIWFAGQDLGEIATGQATDPNSGLLLALLAAAYWPVRHRRLGVG
jgi:uncharacterized membrane protein YwaF